MNNNIISRLKTLCRNVYENRDMSRCTTMRTGGLADIFTEPQSEEEIQNIIRLCIDESVPYIIIGNGSNLIVSDDGIDGVVIFIGPSFSKVWVDECTITAECGILMSRLARFAADLSLTGLEFASGIPGTLGGGVCMNAGAYGGELKDVIKSVTYIDEKGELVTLPIEKLDMSYRHSIFSDRKCAVIRCVMELKKGNKDEINAAMAELNGRRKEKQPLEYPSAGSTFKRPVGHFAGQLIEQAGLKGFSVGGAMVSEKHAGFVINKGGATSTDVIRLIGEVQKRVLENSGVKIEPEVRIIGRNI